MFDKNYFLSQLRNGESLDTMAKGIADAMNDAMVDFQAELEERHNAERMAEIESKKYELAKQMVHIIQEYGMLVAPDAKEILDQVTEEDLDVMIKTLDEMFHMMTSMINLKNKLEGLDTPKAKSDDDVLANFIASLM